MNRLLLFLFVVAASGQSYAGGHHSCCADCGCNHGLRKVCRWECEEVEVKVPGWDCECEDLVIPGKSPYCIKDDCDECCDPCNECCHDCVKHLGGCLHHTKEWGAPCGCCVKTVKVLVKTEKTIKKKVWKPVIETVCDSCCAAGGCANGSCTAAPGMDGAPMDAAPTVAPEGDSPMPPMPPVPSPASQASSRRGIKPLWSAFAPSNRRR
jgi:hypothetical protein